MEKVHLTIDSLQVQSFVTAEPEAALRGTVRGQEAPTDRVECPTQNGGTCLGSCPDNSCGCYSAECTVDDCWYTDWGPCTWGGTGNPSDC